MIDEAKGAENMPFSIMDFASRTHARAALWSDVCMDLLTLSTSSEMSHGRSSRLMMIVAILIVTAATAGYMIAS